ncbi:MAG: protein-L-isoaspartate(D-aspartate) O-methyltransferase [Bacteroidia bacterium]|nr:protein-L-isoaspartate(D-aspartate) O-methyltransferase [Bacteroidia bacterium]MDW8158901.1 protein-L-isoaspartate(D-aspartate) O-methyltransferase [Bacteroidia bacterium]
MLKDSYKYKGLREILVAKLHQSGIRDKNILEAMLAVPRHFFLESAFAEQAYEDIALPIAEGQTISQPYTVAYQTQLLELQPGDKVLEIGTGSGYQAAILCQMGMDVYSIERNPKLHMQAQKLLNELGYHPHLLLGDGTLGWPEFAPYHGIVVTAASPGIPKPLKEQLAVGGRLVIPVGDLESQQMLRLTRISESETKIEEFKYFKFVPLIGKEGWHEK